MFDNIEHRHQHTTEKQTVTVQEFRAPTDDSLKLLLEMEQAVLDKILGSVRLQDSELSCVVHLMSDVLSSAYLFTIEYGVGITRRRINYCHPFYPSFTPERIISSLAEVLAKDIANFILQDPLKEALKQLESNVGIRSPRTPATSGRINTGQLVPNNHLNDLKGNIK